MSIDAQANLRTLRDVLVGEVFLVSGQSNMELPLLRAEHAERELSDAELPSVRLFKVPRAATREPEFRGAGQWQPACAETAAPFSAIDSTRSPWNRPERTRRRTSRSSASRGTSASSPSPKSSALKNDSRNPPSPSQRTSSIRTGATPFRKP